MIHGSLRVVAGEWNHVSFDVKIMPGESMHVIQNLVIIGEELTIKQEFVRLVKHIWKKLRNVKK